MSSTDVHEQRIAQDAENPVLPLPPAAEQARNKGGKLKKRLGRAGVGALAVVVGVGIFEITHAADKHSAKTTLNKALNTKDKELASAEKEIRLEKAQKALGLRLGSLDLITDIVGIKSKDGHTFVDISYNPKDKKAAVVEFEVEPEPHVPGGIELVDSFTQQTTGTRFGKPFIITYGGSNGNETSTLNAIAGIAAHQ